MTIKIEFYRRYFDRDFHIGLHRRNWTETRFGKPNMRNSWFVRTYIIPTRYGINELREVYYFKKEKDAVLFALRWGS